MIETQISDITRPDDAVAAARAGVSYLGVIFTPGPCKVTESLAREIVLAAGRVPVIGVFAGRLQVSEILRISAEVGLAGVQLSPPHSTADARRIRAMGLQVWRTLPLESERDLAWLAGVREAATAVVVGPAPRNGGVSGTPVSLPLYLAREARAHLPGHQMVLAGGLTPENVGEAIAEVRPDIVSVASGLDLLPGVKDAQRIQQFMEAVFGHCTRH
jgi:phosphoribosylanthranilate isomerase